MTKAKRHFLADAELATPPLTLSDDLAISLDRRIVELQRVRWPSPKYRGRYTAFAREILGIQPWEKQIEIFDLVSQYERVAVSSGHKTGKTWSEGVIALCDYCSYDDMRVIVTSTTAHQVDEVFWRELGMLTARAGKCVDCLQADPYDHEIPRPCPHSAFIDGTFGLRARTGLKSGYREIIGLTASEGEAIAGISGANLRFIVDEASGVKDRIFRAIEGNRAGGASLLLFSNPTRNEGVFFEAFHEKSKFWKTLIVSSESTPNVQTGERLIPGLATLGYIEERKDEWGEDSAEYKIRIKGEFAEHEAGAVFSIHAIGEAEVRWADAPDDGRLFIGVDPAGATGTGDESCFVMRRGKKMIDLECARGLNDDQHMVRVLSLISKYQKANEIKPVVVIDREGAVGSSLYGRMRDFVERNEHAFELVAVRASDLAVRQPAIYDRMRDELAANLEGWLRDGGAIVSDVKLEKELHAMRWAQRARDGKLKITSKDQLRKQLGRSPDRYDALSLAVWEPLHLRDAINPAARAQMARDVEDMDPLAGVPLIDPYAASDYWRGR